MAAQPAFAIADPSVCRRRWLTPDRQSHSANSLRFTMLVSGVRATQGSGSGAENSSACQRIGLTIRPARSARFTQHLWQDICPHRAAAKFIFAAAMRRALSAPLPSFADSQAIGLASTETVTGSFANPIGSADQPYGTAGEASLTGACLVRRAWRSVQAGCRTEPQNRRRTGQKAKTA